MSIPSKGDVVPTCYWLGTSTEVQFCQTYQGVLLQTTGKSASTRVHACSLLMHPYLNACMHAAWVANNAQRIDSRAGIANCRHRAPPVGVFTILWMVKRKRRHQYVTSFCNVRRSRHLISWPISKLAKSSHSWWSYVEGLSCILTEDKGIDVDSKPRSTCSLPTTTVGPASNSGWDVEGALRT